MKMGSVKQALPASLAAADLVFCFTKGLDWNVAETLRPLGGKVQCIDDIDALANTVAGTVRSGDHVVIMSNGGFGNVHEKLLNLLRAS